MKTYNSILIATVCLIVGVCTGIILWAQPISGDLTRIGAYPERWFGWNTPQQRIPDQANTEKSAGKKHILVVGDSFSEAGRWQASLGDRYAFSFIHAKNTNIDKFVARIERDKPDAVVVESVERFSLAMFGEGSQFMGHTSDTCPPATTHHAVSTNVADNTVVEFPLYNRKTFPGSAKEISQGFHYVKLWSEFLRKPKKQKAVILDLANDKLFSSQRRDQLLVIRDDLLLAPDLDEKTIRTVHCSMRSVASRIAATGVAHAFLIVPDKTTAYQPFLVDEGIRQKRSVVERIVEADIPHMIDMLPATRLALAAGEVDFYLPNDTHWGYKGFQLAARLIDGELQQQWTTTGSRE
jgi:hypothetical protein